VQLNFVPLQSIKLQSIKLQSIKLQSIKLQLGAEEEDVSDRPGREGGEDKGEAEGKMLEVE